MSNLQSRARAAYGIERWLRSRGYKTTNKSTADITASFLKYKGIKYVKFNKRYKGLFTPIICNAYDVQEHFNEFTKFVLENFKPEE